MFQLKKPIAYLMTATLFVLMAYQSIEIKKVIYPENEIPVSTTSDEALQKFVTGLDIFEQGNVLKGDPLRLYKHYVRSKI
ncbi:MAG: hypothetical protein ACI9HJ_002209 [Ulvibacter sp.]